MPLAWIVLALLGANAQRPRRAWDSVGVDIDDLTGGLLTLGILPEGWQIPAGAALTLPPRVLEGVRWPGPADSGWVFVTENPSVVAAALDRALVADDGAPVRLVCTIGTPSDLEITASISEVTPLELAPDDTPWDPTLGPAMTAGATVVFEEDLLEDLLQDLRSGQGPVA
jgi:hypothetical protein